MFQKLAQISKRGQTFLARNVKIANLFLVWLEKDSLFQLTNLEACKYLGREVHFFIPLRFPCMGILAKVLAKIHCIVICLVMKALMVLTFAGTCFCGDRTDHISRLFIFEDKLPLKH